MKNYDLLSIQEKLQENLDDFRFQHTLGVMYMCAALSMAHGYDLTRAQTAGLLHDCAKCIPNKKKLRLCERNHIPLTDFEKEHPVLIHAKLGACVAKEKYGVDDPEILSAIQWHTTGKPDMTKLEKIVYIADYIEPHRDKAPGLPEIRREAFLDLDECMYMILQNMMEYLSDNPKDSDPATKETFDWYKELHLKRRSEE